MDNLAQQVYYYAILEWAWSVPTLTSLINKHEVVIACRWDFKKNIHYIVEVFSEINKLGGSNKACRWEKKSQKG